jgi:HPr kinase/phosphorylase
MATIHHLINETSTQLMLCLVEGEQGVSRTLDFQAVAAADMVGHLNIVHANRIQVLGKPEIKYYQKLRSVQREHVSDELFAAGMPAMIVAEGLDVPDSLRARCRAHQTPLLTTVLPAAKVIDGLRIYLNKLLSKQGERHGVLMDVLGMGVLITGDSGLGKSELALELISRGHGLVADDMVEVMQIGPNMIEGRCPDLLQNLLEVRGIGLLDIKAIFGETAVRRRMRIKLVVHLARCSSLDEANRLPAVSQYEELLGVAIRKVVLPVAVGRNLAVLLEAAVRNTILQLRGIDTMGDFIKRQQVAMVLAAAETARPIDYDTNVF